jgi:hypothetical protein
MEIVTLLTFRHITLWNVNLFIYEFVFYSIKWLIPKLLYAPVYATQAKMYSVEWSWIWYTSYTRKLRVKNDGKF